MRLMLMMSGRIVNRLMEIGWSSYTPPEGAWSREFNGSRVHLSCFVSPGPVGADWVPSRSYCKIWIQNALSR